MNKEELIEKLKAIADYDAQMPNCPPNHPCSVAIIALNQYQGAIERCQQIASLPRAINLSPADMALINDPYNPKF